MLGGAVLVADGGTATFEDCHFEENRGENGAGLLVQCGARALLYRCTFRNNRAGMVGLGGAIGCVGGYVEIHESLFEFSTATDSDLADGGAIWLHVGAEARVFDSTFRRGFTRGSGGAIAMNGAKLHIERSYFEENTSIKAGGAIYAGGTNDLTILDCTFKGNLANSGGGGLCVHNDTRALVRNCAFIKNFAPGGAAIATGGTPRVILESSVVVGSSEGPIYGLDGGRFEIRNSIFWGNVFWGGRDTPIVLNSPEDALIEHSIIEGPTVWPGPGNSNADPLFVGPEDVHLQPGSPAIDQGTPTGALDRDLEGKARPCGAGVDIGVYELGDCELRRFRRGDADGSADLGLTDAVLILGQLFLGQAAPACLDAADADDDGQVVITDAVYLLRSLFLGGPGLPAPSDACGVDPTADEVFCRENLGCPD